MLWTGYNGVDLKRCYVDCRQSWNGAVAFDFSGLAADQVSDTWYRASGGGGGLCW